MRGAPSGTGALLCNKRVITWMQCFLEIVTFIGVPLRSAARQRGARTRRKARWGLVPLSPFIF